MLIMSDEIVCRSHNKVKIIIDSKEYTVDAFLSISDFEDLVDTDEQNARLSFARFIQKRIINNGNSVPTIESISAQEDTNFQELIDSLVNDDHLLKECFEKRDKAEPLCDRFLYSLKDESKIMSKKVSEALENAIPKLPQFEIPTDIIENLNKTLNRVAETINAITSSFTETWKNFSFPGFTEKEKENIISAQIQWGEYGWTQPPESPVRLFYEKPSNAKEAYNQASEYCSNAYMDFLFSDLRRMKFVKKADLDEAIFDYKNRKYKSCALILFGLIDARLIRLQRKEDRNKKGKRASGASAARKLAHRIESTHDLSQMVFFLFSFQNVGACLQKVFADGNDFKTQPEVINRNFLDHGMLHRKVTKRDCIQLFLLYYNLLELLAIISPTKEAQ